MLFNSYLFLLAFLPAVLALYFLIGAWRPVWAVGALALASLVFYASGSPPRHLLVLLLSIAGNYAIGRLLAPGRLAPVPRKLVLTLGVAANLGVIGYFKYANFLLDVVGFSAGDILLPLGISFFTFTQIAFLVDVYRGLAKEYSPVHYLLFVTYFPHLIAGPVLHHKEMMPQFADPTTKRFQPASFAAGTAIFAIGLIKKVGLADTVAATADAVFSAPAKGLVLTIGEAWSGALAYAMQIYFDFSGYSDMAIGLSLMFGVLLPLNFNSPYKAANIIEFWRRWHMTLSRFLRDYLYVPIGGNRCGAARRYLNLLITMVLGGLWHGAAWTFVAWGALHGAFLLINHAWREIVYRRGVPAAFAGRAWKVVATGLTFLAVIVAWVPFRANDFATAKAVLGAMFGANGLALSAHWARALAKPAAKLAGWGVHLQFDGGLVNDLFGNWTTTAWTLVLLTLVALGLPNTQEIVARSSQTAAATGRLLRALRWQPSAAWGVAVGVLLAAGMLLISGDSPFLYFRF